MNEKDETRNNNMRPELQKPTSNKATKKTPATANRRNRQDSTHFDIFTQLFTRPMFTPQITTQQAERNKTQNDESIENTLYTLLHKPNQMKQKIIDSIRCRSFTLILLVFRASLAFWLKFWLKSSRTIFYDRNRTLSVIVWQTLVSLSLFIINLLMRICHIIFSSRFPI